MTGNNEEQNMRGVIFRIKLYGNPNAIVIDDGSKMRKVTENGKK